MEAMREQMERLTTQQLPAASSSANPYSEQPQSASQTYAAHTYAELHATNRAVPTELHERSVVPEMHARERAASAELPAWREAASAELPAQLTPAQELQAARDRTARRAAGSSQTSVPRGNRGSRPAELSGLDSPAEMQGEPRRRQAMPGAWEPELPEELPAREAAPAELPARHMGR
jgi:hypothetical protein